MATVAPWDKAKCFAIQSPLDVTAGNLSTHARKLEEAENVAVTTAHRGRTPVSYLELTTTGRLAFERYRRSLAELLGGAS